MNDSAGGWLVDGHVHLHECFDLDTFFRAASDNFAAAARRAGLPPSTPGCLFLAETATQMRFRDLRDHGLATNGGWSVRRKAEPLSVWAEHASGASIALIAGRQIATAEGLEVLAVGYDRPVADGSPIRQVLQSVSDAGAIPIIPWGFGKWWFRRGVLLEELITNRPIPELFLGDNGGRARASPTPRLFRLAASQRVWNLPGSDPLPLGWHVDRAGSYGFHFACETDLERPATQLLGLLRAATAQPALFGTHFTLTRFARAQIGIRTNTRRRRRARR